MATKINDNILNRSKLTACARCELGNNITVSKNFTWGAVQIPFNRLNYSHNGVFTLENGKIYSNTHCIVRVNFSIYIPSTSYYILVGKNGGYNYVGGPQLENNILGYSYAGYTEFEINSGEYISCMIGTGNAFSNQTIYSSSNLGVSIVRLLD